MARDGAERRKKPNQGRFYNWLPFLSFQREGGQQGGGLKRGQGVNRTDTKKGTQDCERIRKPKATKRAHPGVGNERVITNHKKGGTRSPEKGVGAVCNDVFNEGRSRLEEKGRTLNTKEG